METVIDNGFILQAPDCDGESYEDCAERLYTASLAYFGYYESPTPEHAAPFEPNWDKLADRATD
jgi:hypothetical protein